VLRACSHLQFSYAFPFAAAVALTIGSSGCPGPAAPPDGNSAPATALPQPPSQPVFDPFTPEAGFRLLKLSDFDRFPADANTWSERDGLLICSGNPKGYAYSREDFSNFTLRCEYRFVSPAQPPDLEAANKFNTGFMIHIQEPHKVWPASLEVQGRFDEMAAIKSNGGVPPLTIQDDQEAREGVRIPVGQWNAIEIISHNGALTAILNGLPVCSSMAGELKSGRLGLQSEGFEVEFKHLRVKVEE